jgi:UDP:flavonoid glycosyltransferase YjiC (YdhE family)
MPHLRATYEDLTRAVAGPPKIDVLVAGELVYPAPLLGEKMGLRWASHITAPMSFFSAQDPPVLAIFPRFSQTLRRMGPGVNRLVIRLIQRVTRGWSEPIRALRTEIGLSGGQDPIYAGKFSPSLVLASFSPVLARPQPDWPAHTVVTGFVFYDGQPEPPPAELLKFLEAGEPPLVFTLGSSAVLDPGNFYREGAEAARRLGKRAVLLMGRNAAPVALPPGVLGLGYVAFSQVLPRAAAVVHQGGIGTTGQVLRAGRPMLVMPYNFDQPDNAARIARLGAGRVIRRGDFSATRVARHLQLLLGHTHYGPAAAELGRQVRQENGAVVAADAIEGLLVRPQVG